MFTTSAISFCEKFVSATVCYSIFFLSVELQKDDAAKKMGEFALFQPCNHLLEVIMGKITGVLFEDSFRGLGQRRVKQHDRHHVLSERLRYATKLLGQHPDADDGVAGGKAEFDKLPRLPFQVSRGSTVVQKNENVGDFEEKNWLS